MNDFINILIHNKTVEVLLIMIIFDVVFGILRAWKEHSTNSTIGINGMIRKTGMILSSLFLYLLDFILNFNFICFIPEEIMKFLNFQTVGIGTVFGILYILFEFLSILKNMTLCELPIPAKIQSLLEKLCKEMTAEIKQ